MPIVSVITPIFNGEKYLVKFIKNLQDITFKDVEYIFIDNNSTENSITLLNKLLFSTDLNYVVLSEIEQGAGHARNRGIKEAKGKYLVFLDCDDSIDPRKIDYDLEIMKENEVDFVFCRALKIYEDGRQIKHPIGGIKQGVNNPPDLGLIWLKHFFYLQGSGSLLIKKQVVLDLGCFNNSRTGEDAFLFIRMGLVYKGYFYDKTFFNYYRYSDSTISTVNRDKDGTLFSYFNIRKELFKDSIIQHNYISRIILANQIQGDLLKLSKAGYKIKDLIKDDRLKDLKLDFIIFNKLSFLINKVVSKNYYNPFYFIWMRRIKTKKYI